MSFNLRPASEMEEVIQNIQTILATPRGSVPMDRAFGVSGDYLDQPMPRAQALMTSDIIQVVAKYEPRAKVISCSFVADELGGILKPSVTFSLVASGASAVV
jgi:uncharacterized protein